MEEYQELDAGKLRREISEAYKDLFEISDKMKVYLGDNLMDGRPRLLRLHAEHIARAYKIESLVNTGKRYFPENDWNNSLPPKSSNEMWDSLEEAIRNTLLGEGDPGLKSIFRGKK